MSLCQVVMSLPSVRPKSPVGYDLFSDRLPDLDADSTRVRD